MLCYKRQQRDETLSIYSSLSAAYLAFVFEHQEMKNIQLWVKYCTRHCNFLYSRLIAVKDERDKCTKTKRHILHVQEVLNHNNGGEIY